MSGVVTQLTLRGKVFIIIFFVLKHICLVHAQFWYLNQGDLRCHGRNIIVWMLHGSLKLIYYILNITYHIQKLKLNLTFYQFVFLHISFM